MLSALTEHYLSTHRQGCRSQCTVSQGTKIQPSAALHFVFSILGGFFCQRWAFHDFPLGINSSTQQQKQPHHLHEIGHPICEGRATKFSGGANLERKGPAHTIWTKGNALINFLIGIKWHQWLNYTLNFISEEKGRSYWINCKKSLVDLWLLIW